jgi:hypothetical protein
VRSKSKKLSLLFSMVILGMAMSPVRAEYIQKSGHEIQTQQNEMHKIKSFVVAGSPAVCKANYDQCMKGCDGASSCSNQCMTNYNGCLH